MNKSANHTKLGKLLSDKINNEAQLNAFIISNFSNNLFDLKDYEDTIEYFREPIKIFDCYQIINNIVAHSTRQIPDNHLNQETSRNHNLSECSDTFLNNNATANTTTSENEGSHRRTTSESQKSYLRLIYDWLKLFYYHQTTSASSYRLSSSFYQSPNPASGSGVSANSAGSAQQAFILRKKLVYHTKYNLTNLLRDLETGMKEICKCEINTSFFSFKNNTNNANVTRNNFNNTSDSSNNVDNIFIENEDFEGENNEFDDLRQSSFSALNNNLSRMENLVITMNAEYYSNQFLVSMSSSTISTTATTHANTITYTRVPSFTGQDHQQQSSSAKSSATTTSATTTAILTTSANSSSSSNNSHSTLTNNNIMSKSICSMSGGDLESSLSLSLSVSNSQLKRTYCFLVVSSKLKTLTFYAFTTENANYDAIKQLLDQSTELVKMRYHLVNNTILYKYGGLIGENLIYDFKKGEN